VPIAGPCCLEAARPPCPLPPIRHVFVLCLAAARPRLRRGRRLGGSRGCAPGPAGGPGTYRTLLPLPRTRRWGTPWRFWRPEHPQAAQMT
jgi:hypothetical protein